MLRYSSLTWLTVQHDQWSETLDIYERRLQNAVQGYVSYKRRNGHIYCYLQRRAGDRIVSLYLGMQGDKKVLDARRAIEQRKEWETAYRELDREVAILRKIIQTVVARIEKRIARRKDRSMSEYETHILTRWGHHATERAA